MTKTFRIRSDLKILTQYDTDASYHKERAVASTASKAPKLVGKAIYAFNYPQVLVWTRETRLAMKMSTVYLTAKELFIEFGIPKELLDIAAILFDDLGVKPVAEKLRRSVRFICAAWHMRMLRAFHLLTAEFQNGKHAASYGCGGGIIEILALIASGSKSSKLTLIDIDPANIALAEELLTLFYEHGYDCREQVTIITGDIHTCQLPAGTDIAVSIGLLHNYFPLETAKSFVDQWLAGGAAKVLTDICHDPHTTGSADAQMRIDFIRNVLDWEIGAPDGLRYYSKEDLCTSLADKTLEIYDHGLNATVVVYAN